MAGRGPAPKDPSQRRRRNQPPPLDALPVEGYTGKFPPLPRSYASGEKTKAGKLKMRAFLPTTRKWYDAWARSPMAVEFTEVHWLRLHDVAILRDRFHRGEHELAGELRLQLAGFGGTPFDVRRLGKTIRNPGVAAGDKGPDRPKLAEVRRLHAV